MHKDKAGNKNNSKSELSGHCVINGSNLHGGGGLQVATSFISDISKNHRDKCGHIHLCISKALFNNLSSLDVDLKSFASVQKIDFSLNNYFKIQNYLKKFEVIFTVFGPAYFMSLGKAKHICGFAQPWICFREYSKDVDIDIFNRFFLNFKFAIQKYFFGKSDALIVESNAVKEALLINSNLRSEIYVVSNAIAETFKDTAFIEKKTHSLSDNMPIVIGYIGRGYKHKNIGILKPVLENLRNKYSLNIEINTTLSNEELVQNGLDGNNSIVNLGPIKSGELKSFYSKINFLILPTLLECFSVSPLEAMSQSVIVFASDRPFIKESCGDHVVYFDPLNVEDISLKIYQALKDDCTLINHAQNAYRYVMSLPTSKDRTVGYLDLINQYKANNR